MIFYDIEKKKYFIEFNANFSKKISIRLIGKMNIPIKEKEIISFGDFILELIPNLNDGSIKIINLKEDKISEYEKKEKTVTIGKSDNCTLCLEKKNNISEIQCNLTYNTKDNLWVLSDGFENKMSDNGTWILASSTYPLYNNLEIDIFSNYLKINIC